MSIKLLSAQQLSDSKTLNQLQVMAKRMEIEIPGTPKKITVAEAIVAKQKEVIAQSDADRLTAHTAITEQATLELSTEQPPARKNTMPKSSPKVIADNIATVAGDSQVPPPNVAAARKAAAEVAKAKRLEKKAAVLDGLTAIANNQPVSEESAAVFADVQEQVQVTAEPIAEPIAETKPTTFLDDALKPLKKRATALGHSLFRTKSGKLNLEPVDAEGEPTGNTIFPNGGTFLDKVTEWIETTEIANRIQAEIDADADDTDAQQAIDDAHRLEWATANKNHSRKTLTAKKFPWLKYAESIGVYAQLAPEEIAHHKSSTNLTTALLDLICDQQRYLTETKRQEVAAEIKAAPEAVAPQAVVQAEIEAPVTVVEPDPLADYQERLVMLLDSAGTDESAWLLENMAAWKAGITPQKKAGSGSSKPSNGGKVKDSTPTGEIKPVKAGTKIATVIQLLHKGTTLAELCEKVNPNESSIKVYLNWDIKQKGYGCRKDDAGNIFLTLPEGVSEPLITAA